VFTDESYNQLNTKLFALNFKLVVSIVCAVFFHTSVSLVARYTNHQEFHNLSVTVKVHIVPFNVCTDHDAVCVQKSYHVQLTETKGIFVVNFLPVAACVST
jgi:hypothetical protein